MADEEEGWRFDVDEVGEDDADSDNTGGADGSASDTGTTGVRTDERDDTIADTDGAGDDAGGVAGAVRGAGAARPIEPGSPRIENVLFVVLGVLVAIALVADFLSIAGF